MKYIIGTLPRSGSYLACQLLEEYLVNKYAYHRIPFFEFVSYSSIHRKEHNVVAHLEGDIIAHSEVPEVDLVQEMLSRMEILLDQEDKNILYLTKLIYHSSPEFVFQFFHKQGYHFVYIERENILDQIISLILASLGNVWHEDPDSRNFPMFGNGSKEVEPFNIDRSVIRRQIAYQNKFRSSYNWTNHTVVKYEEFSKDYSQLYTALGLTDYKKYVPSFDFLKSKPSKPKSNKDLILNYDEAVTWVEEIQNKINSSKYHAEMHNDYQRKNTQKVASRQS